MAKLSVIIATHKRASILKQCLQHLEQQTIAKDLEVIVVSDGHDAETEKLFTLHSSLFTLRLNFFEIPKSQQGVARNRGLQEAEAPLCLFINDDIFLQPDACEKHLAAHSSLFTLHSSLQAVLGHTTWDPALNITPVMRWLEESGWQFGYPRIEKYAQSFVPKNIQHRFTYTSHISLPTHTALEHPFREDINTYGWEDIEWGERLAAAGIRLYYEPSAKAFHHHHLSLEQSLARMEQLGKSVQKFPDSERYPPKWKLLAFRLLIAVNPKSFASQHRKAFLKGLVNKKV